MLKYSRATLALLLATFLVGCATEPKLTPDSSIKIPRTIPVVKTWGDLLKQEPIDLGGGVRVRLGIEATECPRLSGVTLYCLTEGFAEIAGSQDELGPVRISVTTKSQGEKLTQQMPKAIVEDVKLKKFRRLFVGTLAVDDIATYEVAATTDDGKPIASVNVRGTDRFYQPWLACSYNPKSNSFTPFGEAVLPFVLWDKSGFAASDSRFRQEILAHNAGDRLPIFSEEKLSRSLHLEINDQTLVVSASDGILVIDPEVNFVARLWVNEKPFAFPDGVRVQEPSWNRPIEPFQPDDDEAIKRLNVKQLKMRLSCKDLIEWLELKTGDKISIQLLYCEDFLPLPCHDGVFSLQWHVDTTASRRTRISNRVDFIVP